MTLYFSAETDAAGRPGRREYVPGGRWERILTALDAAGGIPRLQAEVWRGARDPDRDTREDRRKLFKALRLMKAAGLVAHTGDGWIITAAGLEALYEGWD